MRQGQLEECNIHAAELSSYGCLLLLYLLIILPFISLDLVTMNMGNSILTLR